MFQMHSHNHQQKVARGRPKMTQTEPSAQSENQSAVAGGTEPSSETSEEGPKKRGRQPGSVTAKAQGETLKRIESGLDGLFNSAVLVMTMAGGKLALDAQAVAMGAPNLKASILELCKQDKKVREFFISLTTGSAYANVAMASLPIVIAILANHNLLPPILGIQPVVPNEQSSSNGIYATN